ncbi:MAG TPA: DUF2845 domain-containing protein [Pseudomonadales bacterium]|nr:DUF2845 domain-containing protein [Pseudomonadales bacterium]
MVRFVGVLEMRGLWWVLGFTLAAAAAPAEAMRCGVGLIQTGQYTYEVLDRCGAPVEQHVKTIYRAINYRDGYYGDDYHRGNVAPIVAPVTVEEWIYDFGPNRLRRRLVFEDGQLVRIDTLDRGGYASPE